MPGTPYPKEPMYRYAFTRLTPDQILAKLGPTAHGGPSSVSPMSDALAYQLKTKKDEA